MRSTGSDSHHAAGWNNSTKLPEGSFNKIRDPASPVTMSDPDEVMARTEGIAPPTEALKLPASSSKIPRHP